MSSKFRGHGRITSIDDLFPQPVEPVTNQDVRFFNNIRARLNALEPKARMVLGIYEARYLSAFVGYPLYKGRNTTYVTLDRHHIEKWLNAAQQRVTESMIQKLTKDS